MSAKAYGKQFYTGQRDGSFVGAQKVLPVVLSLVPCRSLLDVGCGVGPWVASALEQGVTDALGIDGDWVSRSLLSIPEDRFESHDLAKPFDLRRKFDLVVCMEVAEHLKEPSADVLVDNLVRHGDCILFSAAVPGQGGTNHVNEQWPDYWRDKFARRGYRQLDIVRAVTWNDREIPSCYRQNAYLFVAESKLPQHPTLVGAAEQSKPVAWIHPELFADALRRPLPLRRILKEFPSALSATLRARFSRLVGRG